MRPRSLSHHHHHHRHHRHRRQQHHHHHHHHCHRRPARSRLHNGVHDTHDWTDTDSAPSGSAPSGPRGIVSAHLSGLLHLPCTTLYTSSCWFPLRRPSLHLRDNTCTGLKVAPRRSFKPRARFFFLFNVFSDKINFLFFLRFHAATSGGGRPPVSAARRLRLPTSAWVLAQRHQCHIASVRVAANRNINTAEMRERSRFSFFFPSISPAALLTATSTPRQTD